jgi:phosphoglycolate phosphatase
MQWGGILAFKMIPALMVFDLDGTLVDSAPDLLATLDAVLPLHGFRAPADPTLREGIGHGARHLIEVALARQDIVLKDAPLDEIHREFLDYYEANISRGSALYPGVEAMLDRFAAAGWSFAVCTNKREGLSRLLLEDLGAAMRFAAICGGDTFGVCKPDPAHLTGTISSAGGRPETAVMVGDSRTDFDAARNAGIPFVGVSFGYTTIPMADLGPDLLIDAYDDLSPDVASGLIARDPSAPALRRMAGAALP